MTQKSKTSRASKNGKTAARGGASAATPKRRRGRPTKQETQAREADYEQFEGDRVIHRYANRRFYDLAAKKPITLDELAELVRKGEQVRVIDVDNGNEDITRRVLTQIVLEANQQNALEMLPVEFLRKLISATDTKAATFVDNYLKAGAAIMERSMREGWRVTNVFRDQFAHLFENWSPPARPTREPPHERQTESAADIVELRRRLDELLRDRDRGR